MPALWSTNTMGFKPLTIMQKISSKLTGGILPGPKKEEFTKKKKAARQAAKTGGTTPGVVGKK